MPSVRLTAATFSIIEIAKLNGIDPEAYLREALGRIAEGYPVNRIDALMPWIERDPLPAPACPRDDRDYTAGATATRSRPPCLAA